MSNPPLIQVLRHLTIHERKRLERLEERIAWLTAKIKREGRDQGYLVAERSALTWLVGLVRGEMETDAARDPFDTLRPSSGEPSL